LLYEFKVYKGFGAGDPRGGTNGVGGFKEFAFVSHNDFCKKII
jgi:hypothetical protein